MLSFKLEIQESERLVAKGIVCIVRSDGKRIYCRLTKDGKEISLVPLTKGEMVKAEIQESDQTINSEYWEIQVEESEVETRYQEELKKKGLSVPLNTPEAAQKAIEIAQKAKEILERKGDNPEELKAENEDLRAKLELIASKELENRMNFLKLDEDTKKAIRENPERLKGFMLAKNFYDVQSGSGIPSGSAPLNDRQTGVGAEKGFESTKEMVEHLYKNKTPENEAILRKLWSKFAEGIKSRDSTELPFPNTQPESSGDTTIKTLEVSVNKPTDPNQESELKKFGVGKKKKSEQ